MEGNMTRINHNFKSFIAQHLINNNTKSFTRKDGFLTTTEFISTDNKILGIQSIGHYIENKPIQSSNINYYSNKSLTKTTFINREIFDKFPNELCKQTIIIEQKLKQFSDLKKTFSLPTNTKITKFTFFKKLNKMRKEIIENDLDTHYTPWDKPKYTHEISEELLPYKESPLSL